MSITELVRTMVAYNDALHRQMWESILQLNDDLFTVSVEYSHGSIRNQMVHLAAVDGRWTRGLKGLPDARSFNPYADDYPTASSVFALWDPIAREFYDLVYEMDDEQLQRVPNGMDEPIWQVILHVVNHGTDHRAQVLRALHDFGAPTFNQDLIIHLWQAKRANNAV
jgi:uncharacterized damage-inducible protein DinB